MITLPVPGAPVDLVVDLDHTLVRTDTLLEQFAGLVFHQPLTALLVLFSLLGGRASFKARLAALHALDPADLPYNEPLLDFLRAQRAAGRRLHLVTAADHSIAQSVAAHCEVFQSAEGSSGVTNLKGHAKAAHLSERFPDGFTYVGDSAADLKVWARSGGVVLVGVSAGVSSRARGLGVPVEQEFPGRKVGLATWRRALRLHQWAKNLLVFAPLLLSHEYVKPQSVLLSLIAFVALGLMASATYLINDLSDLAADRRHDVKRGRPLAAGEVRISWAVVAVLMLLAGSGALAAAVSPKLLAGLCAYAALTLGYTFGLKRHAVLDVATLASLYTLRIIVGAATIGVAQSIWLLTFSLFLFFSISLAKRYAEIHNLLTSGRTTGIHGRGYRTEDGPTVLALGVASGVASTLIVVLYLMEEAFPSNIYAHPNWLWVAPFVLNLWAARIWLIAGRGELDEDPVAFALKDRFSWMLLIPLVSGFVLATILWP